MKTRNGFVSNSSSSSFIVSVTVFDWEKKKIVKKITESQKKKLLEHGYIFTRFHSPSQFENIRIFKEQKELAPYKIEKSDKGTFYSTEQLGYGITVNQDDEIDFLNKIGVEFLASCHYNQETVISDGKYIYYIPNPGLEAEMYGIKDFDEKNISFKITKEKIKKKMKTSSPSC
jgi:hypothetical protein